MSLWFPIWDKISKPEFRVPEKKAQKKLFFSDFYKCNFALYKTYSCFGITTVTPLVLSNKYLVLCYVKQRDRNGKMINLCSHPAVSWTNGSRTIISLI